jgi:hypothetical protein
MWVLQKTSVFGTLFFCFGNSKTAPRFYCAKHFFENTLRVLSTKLKSSSQWDSCKYEKEYMVFETDNHTVHQRLFNRIRNFSRYFLLLLDHYNTQQQLFKISLRVISKCGDEFQIILEPHQIFEFESSFHPLRKFSLAQHYCRLGSDHNTWRQENLARSNS